METLTIEISNPKVKRLIDDMAALGLISVKETKPSWNERWSEFAKSLPDVGDLAEEDILKEIAQVRNERRSL